MDKKFCFLSTDNSGVSLVIRDCALDSGSLTTDTELVRMSHCGAFYLEGNYVRGCVQSCFEDACNHSANVKPTYFSTFVILTLVIFKYLEKEKIMLQLNS